MNRARDRQNFPEETRLALVEGDLDKNDEGNEALRDAVNDLRRDLNNRIDALNKVAMGILGGITTAAVLLAINIIVQS